jgi:hypothetical protein
MNETASASAILNFKLYWSLRTGQQGNRFSNLLLVLKMGARKCDKNDNISVVERKAIKYNPAYRNRHRERDTINPLQSLDDGDVSRDSGWLCGIP